MITNVKTQPESHIHRTCTTFLIFISRQVYYFSIMGVGASHSTVSEYTPVGWGSEDCSVVHSRRFFRLSFSLLIPSLHVLLLFH